jgi:NAD+ diphosphatase
MLGFTAIGDPADPLVFADGEIAEGRWFTKDEVRSALELGDWASDADAPLLLPGSISIARGMLESWVK